MEWRRQQYVNPPVFADSHLLGQEAATGVRAGRHRADEIDVFQLHDANAFEIVRQMEALRYADPGEGVAFLRDRGIGVDGMAIKPERRPSGLQPSGVRGADADRRRSGAPAPR